MKYRFILILAAMLAFESCGALMQSGTTSGDPGISAGKVESTSPANSASKSNLSPTLSDVSMYGDDTAAWLKASVANYNIYKDAAVIVDDKVVSDLSAVKLSKVKKVTLFEKAPSLKSGEKNTHGAIVISTK